MNRDLALLRESRRDQHSRKAWRETAWNSDGAPCATRKTAAALDTSGEEELNRAMYPIMNLAVGGNMGGTVNISDWSDANIEFAYIRWYKQGAEDNCALN